MKKNIIFISLALILFGVAMRILPHPPNMTPVSAIAFASALYFRKRWSIIMPLAAVMISDILIGFYDWRIMTSVYASFLIVGIISRVSARYRTTFAVGLSVFASSAIFFLITNTAVWLFSPWYAKNISGLLYSYWLGVPFWRNMLIGDSAYTALLVLIFEVSIYAIKKSEPKSLSSAFG